MKFDVYNLGVILWEISSGRLLFPSSKSAITLAVHISGENGEPIEVIKITQAQEPIEGMPSQYTELYKQYWVNNPVNCPESTNTLKQLLSDEVLSRHDLIEISSENSDNSSSHQDNTSALKACECLAMQFLKALEIFEEQYSPNNHVSEGGKALADALCKNSMLTSLCEL
ncbi:hypothetical protein C2G38_2185835 [Gigaspora rosea]|uniref:Protein kinase domain-containing protein n=1 Tax=Gigaspora rosea TaxID=44941 RepID=A0A397V692_9GLOM|nr:hypothetical protein C2G38_2185835 [Gigaspora rosea]